MIYIYIYLFFFLIYSLSSICQTNEAIKLTYRITNYLDLIATGTSEVYILNEEKKSINVLSKYTYKKSKHTLDDAIYTLPKSKDANFIYITDLRNNKLISKENTIDEFFYIKEPITIQKWELLDEFKTLNDVKLQKATTTFRGRNYIAWCDLNTPISQGPWKFNNLPGLAYEIFDDALDYHFEWQLIKISEPKEYDFSSYDFSKEKFITQQDFIKTLDYFYKTNEDIASTRLLETLDVEVLGVTHHKINYRIRQKEKKYEWEE
nr:GLPGLI family protein [uncultured Flavobacterium sp.]